MQYAPNKIAASDVRPPPPQFANTLQHWTQITNFSLSLKKSAFLCSRREHVFPFPFLSPFTQPKQKVSIPLSHIFIQQILMEHLVHARCCSSHQDYSNGPHRQTPVVLKLTCKFRFLPPLLRPRASSNGSDPIPLAPQRRMMLLKEKSTKIGKAALLHRLKMNTLFPVPGYSWVRETSEVLQWV